MKYLFILGRNIELSKLEVVSYLKRFDFEILDSSLRENGFLVEVNKELSKNAIDFLGGVIAIGEVLGEVENLENIEIYDGKKNNFSYAVFDFSDEDVSDYLKKRFREEKYKASQKHIGKFMQTQENEKVSVLSSGRKIDVQYFVFENLFGKIVYSCDYSEIERRDMKKPVRRESLAISPRLAKIMVNLSLIKTKEKLLDGFCGIGVVLQEALLQGTRVVGVDKDRDAIDGAKKNMQWFRFAPQSYTLINNDSTKVRIPEVQVFVSEPDLGEVLKKNVNEERARKIISNFENLMNLVLKNVQGKVRGRFVFTTPLIRTLKKVRVGVSIDNLLAGTGLKVVENFPIGEFRKNQSVGRRIFVLE